MPEPSPSAQLSPAHPDVVRRKTLFERGGDRTALAEHRQRPGLRFVIRQRSAPTPELAEASRLDWTLRAGMLHPNLVPPRGCGVDGEGVWCFREWVEGTPFAAAVAGPANAALPELAAEALAGLARLHDEGLAHGGLHPGNVLVRASASLGARVVLLDGGWHLTDDPSDAALAYVAPERLDGDPASARSDLYELGTLLFAALHGRPPIELRDGDRKRFRAAVRTGRRARPGLPAGLPPGLQDWLESLLAPDPAGRPDTAFHAWVALARCCPKVVAAETSAGRAARLGSGTPPGREDELRSILDDLERERGPRAILLCGPADSGKTRILASLVQAGRARGHRIEGPHRRLSAPPAEVSGWLLIDDLDRSPSAVHEWLAARVRDPSAAGASRVVATLRPDVSSSPCLRGLSLAAGPIAGLRRVDLAALTLPALKKLVARARAEAPSEDVTHELLAAGPAGFGRTARWIAWGTAPAVDAERAELSGAARAWLEAPGSADPLALVDPAALECATIGLALRTDSGWEALRRPDEPRVEQDEGAALDASSRADAVRGAIARSLELGRRGALGEALRAAEEAEWDAVLLADAELRAAAAAARARVLVAAGRAEEALAAARACAASGVAGLGVLEARLAVDHAAADLRDAIGRLVDDARRAERDDLVAWGLLLECERRAASDDADAEELHEQLERAAARIPGDGPAILTRLDLARARVALARGDPERGAALAAAAAERAAGSDLAWLAVRASALLAEARRAAGEPATAAESSARLWLDTFRERAGVEAAASATASLPALRRLLDARPGTPTERRLAALYDLSRTLHAEADPEARLERILDAALDVVGAERGMILLREGGELRVRCARNLERQTIADASAFSRHVAEEAGAGRSVLAVDTEQDQRLRELRSISAYGIRSVLCVPLRSRGAVVGAVYVDSRAGGATFVPGDLEFLEALADHAALALDGARARRSLAADNERLRAAAEAATRYGILGASAAMREVFGWIEKCAASDLPVLVRGESGTGKELVARAIHFQGPRRDRPFVAANCAAVPEALMHGELFGHVRGAFTGADRDRPGLFELADGGTLFLDEIGDMAPALQALLLRVLQEQEVRRVGGSDSVRVNVRVVAATHRDLQQAVAEGRFRADLLYRLQVLVVQLPPLRARDGDLPLLVGALLDRVARQRGRRSPAVEAAALARLAALPWPGNVRQLEATLQRLAVVAGDQPITEAMVTADPVSERDAGTPEPSPLSLEAGERQQIERALEAAAGNRTRAARLLGISRATLLRKVRAWEP